MRKEEKRAVGDDYKKKMFLGRLEGKKHYSIGRGSEFFDKPRRKLKYGITNERR